MSPTPFVRHYADGSSIQLSCDDDRGIRPAWDVECRWRDGRLRFRHRVFATSEDEAQRQADALAPAAPGSEWVPHDEAQAPPDAPGEPYSGEAH